MRGKVIGVSPSARTTKITIEIEHGQCPDTVFPAWDGKGDKEAQVEHGKRYIAKRNADVAKWKSDRPGRALMGKMVTVSRMGGKK